jgi:hypothetical protein
LPVQSARTKSRRGFAQLPSPQNPLNEGCSAAVIAAKLGDEDGRTKP